MKYKLPKGTHVSRYSSDMGEWDILKTTRDAYYTDEDVLEWVTGWTVDFKVPDVYNMVRVMRRSLECEV